MARVVVTGPADADSAVILADLARRAGFGAAAKYSARFESIYGQLAHFPGIGSPRPALGRDIRIFPVLPYVVIYRHMERDDIVMIVRIVHGRRNITRRLLRNASISPST
jgi:toxin ParE1/3/4